VIIAIDHTRNIMTLMEDDSDRKILRDLNQSDREYTSREDLTFVAFLTFLESN
jgi:hypothetical protein